MSPIPKCRDRIRLLRMPDDPDSIPPGTLGTVLGITQHQMGRDRWIQIDVSWDNGRELMLVSPDDTFEIIDSAE